MDNDIHFQFTYKGETYCKILKDKDVNLFMMESIMRGMILRMDKLGLIKGVPEVESPFKPRWQVDLYYGQRRCGL